MTPNEVHERPYISETVQIPTPKPYIFMFLMKTGLVTPGRVAQSVGHLTRKSEVLGSLLGLATYFRFSFY